MEWYNHAIMTTVIYDNPYLGDYIACRELNAEAKDFDGRNLRSWTRGYLIEQMYELRVKYAFAIPDDDALDAID